jgi:hypothetical protein
MGARGLQPASAPRRRWLAAAAAAVVVVVAAAVASAASAVTTAPSSDPCECGVGASAHPPGADAAGGGGARPAGDRAPPRARTLRDFDVVLSGGARVHFRSSRRSVQARSQRAQPFPDDLALDLTVFDATVHLELQINEHLLHPDAVQRDLHDGKVVRERRPEHRYYQCAHATTHASVPAALV